MSECVPKTPACLGLRVGPSKTHWLTRPQLGPFFVLKFVRSRGLAARFLQPLPKSLVTGKYFSNTKMAVNGR